MRLSGQNGLHSVWGTCRCGSRFAQDGCVGFIGDAGADILVWLEHVDSQVGMCVVAYMAKNKSSLPRDNRQLVVFGRDDVQVSPEKMNQIVALHDFRVFRI